MYVAHGTVEELLATWREAERVLESVPPLSRDHESVALAVVRLRTTYQRLTDRQERSAALVAEADRVARDCAVLLERVKRGDRED